MQCMLVALFLIVVVALGLPATVVRLCPVFLQICPVFQEVYNGTCQPVPCNLCTEDSPTGKYSIFRGLTVLTLCPAAALATTTCTWCHSAVYPCLHTWLPDAIIVVILTSSQTLLCCLLALSSHLFSPVYVGTGNGANPRNVRCWGEHFRLHGICRFR